MANLILPEIVAAAQDAQRATGVPACLALGQCILESNWGRELSAPFNGLGIKHYPGCPYPFEAQHTQEEVNGQMVTITADFVSFPSWNACFMYYGKLLTDPHGPYRKALPFLPHWRAFLHAIAHIYATDSQYEQKVTQIVIDNHLESYNVGPA
jgi:flagellum-specific peptidoglycan hydrolase FlgJ